MIVNDTKRNPNAKGAELLARYCDVLLKKNTKAGISERDMEDKLGRIVRDRGASPAGRASRG